MAAPVASYVQLPSDASNTGKKNRTHTKAVGSDTVHEHFVVPTENYTRHGRYIHCSTVNRAVVNTAVAITTDTVATYLAMSTASVKVGVLRHVAVSYGQAGTAAAFLTAPLISATKFTFATAFSGTTQNILQTQTASTTPGANVRVAAVGATITPVGVLGVMTIPALVTTVGAYGGSAVLYNIDEHYNRGTAVEFGPGEGIAVHQTANGTASDTRVYTVRLVWDEIDVA